MTIKAMERVYTLTLTQSELEAISSVLGALQREIPKDTLGGALTARISINVDSASMIKLIHRVMSDALKW